MIIFLEANFFNEQEKATLAVTVGDSLIWHYAGDTRYL